MSNQDLIKTDNVLVRVMVPEKDASTEWHYHTGVNVILFAYMVLSESKLRTLKIELSPKKDNEQK